MRARRSAFVAYLLSLIAVLANSAVAQFDAKAPEPIHPVGGTLFIGGGGEIPDEALDRFVEMAGADNAKLVFVTLELDPAPATFDKIEERAERSVRLHSIGPNVPNALANATDALAATTGAWLDAADSKRFAELTKNTPLERALQDLIQRGGVIGCNGPVARRLTSTAISEDATDQSGLDLIPGAVIDTGVSEASRKRLLDFLQRHPRRVGLGVEAGTVMVVHRRFIDVLGSGSAWALLAASERSGARVEQINRSRSPSSQRRPRRGRAEANSPRRRNRRRADRSSRPWRPRRLEDLIALSRDATARALPKFPADTPPTPHVASGTLMIVGGGGSPRGFTEKFIELAGGPDAPLVYIPCSESTSIEREPRILEAWRRAGAKYVRWIHTKDRALADTSEDILDPLRDARGIFFGGGRQWNLVDSYQHTEAHRLMHEVLARGGVIAGSSAGASIQASYMVRGNSLGNRDPMAPGYETGLGFLTGVAIDQHFSQRNRLGDMTALVTRHPQLLGIGIDEAACLIVQGSVAQVWAREGRAVLFYDRRRETGEGQPDYIRVADGQRFDLAKRKVVRADEGK